jgi:hypothetical protein
MAPKKTNAAQAPKEKTMGSKNKVTKVWTFEKYKNGKLNLLKAPARFKTLWHLQSSELDRDSVSWRNSRKKVR